MKRLICLVTAIMLVLAVSGVSWAGGDKNCNRHQGDKGKGSVIQVQKRLNR